MKETKYDKRTTWPSSSPPSEAIPVAANKGFHECLPIPSVYTLEMHRIVNRQYDSQEFGEIIEALLNQNPVPEELQKFLDPSDLERYLDQIEGKKDEFLDRAQEDILGDPSFNEFLEHWKQATGKEESDFDQEPSRASQGGSGSGTSGIPDLWKFWRCVAKNLFQEAIWMWLKDAIIKIVQSKLPESEEPGLIDKYYTYAAGLLSMTVPQVKVGLEIVMLGETIHGVWYGCLSNPNDLDPPWSLA